LRILVYTENKDLTESDFRKKANVDLDKYIFIDIVRDLEEAEYLLDIRGYNQIFLDFNENKYKKYYNLFKVINKLSIDFSYDLFLLYDKESNKLNSLKEQVKSIYKNMNITYIQDKTANFISEKIYHGFYQTPSIIDSYEIDMKNQKIVLTIENERFEIPVKYNREFKVIIFFIQHYGEVVNIDTILSGIVSEPEEFTNSRIETTISSIRNSFELLKLKVKNPIVAHKRIGYRFALI